MPLDVVMIIYHRVNSLCGLFWTAGVMYGVHIGSTLMARS